jgi:hypothetical protein
MTRLCDLDAIKMVIRTQHCCQPEHRQTVLVHERTKDGRTVWMGFVEVFHLKGHQEAGTCYAWRWVDAEGKERIVSVLGNQLIDSPQRAVQAAIFSDRQPVMGKEGRKRLAGELDHLRKQIQRGRENIRQAHIKMEDLTAAIEAIISERESLQGKAQGL